MDKIVLFMFSLVLPGCAARDSRETTDKMDKESNIAELSGTKWSYKIADGCINTYSFKADSQYVFYSCEMEDTYYGKYFVQDDTLNLYEYVTATDSLLPADSPERNDQAKFKVIMVDGKLKHIARLVQVNGVWEKSDFTFPENYLYVKVDSAGD